KSAEKITIFWNLNNLLQRITLFFAPSRWRHRVQYIRPTSSQHISKKKGEKSEVSCGKKRKPREQTPPQIQPPAVMSAFECSREWAGRRYEHGRMREHAVRI
ncbi:hypothetical protein NECAME_19301, partial [Necator americanus]